MAETLVTNKARWTLHEFTPLILFTSLAVFVYASGYVFGWWEPIIATIFSIGLLCVSFYLLFVSLGRKRKSTLFAVLKNDKLLGIEVWMRKPLEHKWLGKMDQGKNKVNLAELEEFKFDNIMGTRVLTLVTKNGSGYIPLRLASMLEIKNYLGEAVLGGKKKIRLQNKNDLTELQKYVYLPESKTLEEFLKIGKVTIRNTKDKPVEETTPVAESVSPVAEMNNHRQVIKLNYDRFVKLPTDDHEYVDNIRNPLSDSTKDGKIVIELD